MRVLVLLLLALAGGAAAWPASPAERLVPALAPDPSTTLLAQAVAPIPLESVLRTIDQRYPGRALGARVIDRDGQRIYRIKWLGDDGRVHEISADVESGKILRVR